MIVEIHTLITHALLRNTDSVLEESEILVSITNRTLSSQVKKKKHIGIQS